MHRAAEAAKHATATRFAALTRIVRPALTALMSMWPSRFRTAIVTVPTPPPKLMHSNVRSGAPSKGRRSGRCAQALASVPGSRATALDALAATEGRPANTVAGIETKEPPATAAFNAPARGHAGTVPATATPTLRPPHLRQQRRPSGAARTGAG